MASRRILLALALLAGLLLAPSALASGGAGAVWDGNRVVVSDYTSDFWAPYIEAAVRQWDAVMPRKAPRFVYQDKSEKTCNEVGNKPTGIAVCMWPAADASGQTWVAVERHVAHYAKVYIAAWADQWPEQTACHELGHAFTNVNDNYGAHPDTSCVQGWLLEPGSWDRAFAQRAYKKHADALGRKRQGR